MRTDIRVERLQQFTHEAQTLLEEYYAAIGVVRQDGPQAMTQLLAEPRSAMWLARVDKVAAGCVVLKAGVPQEDTAECKRLYVRPSLRRLGIADKLMDALEQNACAAGLEWIYLDTNELFRASVALYQRRGFEPCARYNDNPQATMFFRKRVGKNGR